MEDNIQWRKGQDEFYNRTTEFLSNNDKDILLNPAGMGIGKTLATSKAIKDNYNNYNFFLIANPTAPLKEVWGEELNKLKGFKNKYMIWFAKNDMCLLKKENIKFDTSKCSDDCEYRRELESNKSYHNKCNELLNLIKLPTTPNKFYQKYGYDNCLYSPNRLGMKSRNILIGDYFAFLNKRMVELVINQGEYKKRKDKGCLIIDEAHLVPQRTKQFLSKYIVFDKFVRELKKDISCDPIIKDIRLLSKLEDIISNFEKLLKYLYETNKQNDTKRYTYLDFITDYNKFGNFDEMIDLLKILKKDGYSKKADGEDYEKEDEPYFFKFLRFIDMWLDKYNDKDYGNYFQYSIKSKDKIRFFINCQDTSKYLKNVFSDWQKVILNSGTITDEEYYNYQTGINDLNTQSCNHIVSYDIKDNVVLYPNGNFTSKNRIATYNNNKKVMRDIIKNLDGRTIIYIQKKEDSILLEAQLKVLDKSIINFCIKDDGWETKKEDFDECTNLFNKTKNSVAIININGRVEGFNFLDDNGGSVNNIIVYGYPFPKRGIIFEDELNYYTNLCKSQSKARKWLDYVPVLERIEQACFRAKRSKEDQPIILLWDNQFGNGMAYNYMPSNLKGEKIYDEQQLISNLKKRNNERTNNI